MVWHSWGDFLHMGGYGLYVWGSYAVTLVLLLAEVRLARRRQRDALVMAARDAEALAR